MEPEDAAKSRPELDDRGDPNRALIKSQREQAIAQRKRGDLDGALISINAILKDVASPKLKMSDDLDIYRAALHFDRAKVFEARGELNEAIADLNSSLDILDAPHLANCKELDENRARTLSILSQTLDESRDFKGALVALERALNLFELPHVRNLDSILRLRAWALHAYGSDLYNAGRYQEALDHLDHVVRLFDESPFRDRKDLEEKLVRIHGTRGLVFQALQNYSGALAACESARKLLFGSNLRDRRDLDVLRATLYFDQAEAYAELMDYFSAAECYKSAIRIYAGPHLHSNKDLDEKRARSELRRGKMLLHLNRIGSAFPALERAHEIYERPHLRDQSNLSVVRKQLQLTRDELDRRCEDLVEARAQIFLDKAVEQRGSGDLRGAVESIEFALEVYSVTPLLQREDSFEKCVDLLETKVEILGRLEEWSDQISCLDFILELYRLDRRGRNDDLVEKRAELLAFGEDLDERRAQLLVEKGLALDKLDDHCEEIRCYDVALEYFSGSNLGSRKDLDEERARVSGYRAIALQSTDEFDRAIKDYDEALRLYNKPHLRCREDLFKEVAQLHECRAVTLHWLEDWHAAAEGYEKALQVYARPSLRDRKDLNEERARLLCNRALIFGLEKDHESELLCYEQALDHYARPPLKNREVLDGERARLKHNQAVALEALGNIKLSIDAYKDALELYAQPHLRDDAHVELLRAQLLAGLSAHSGYMDYDERYMESDERRAFFEEGSMFLADKVELPPLPNPYEENDVGEQYREHFSRFHTNWLCAALENGWWDDVVRVLGTIQGRDMASRMLDELDESDTASSDHPQVVRELQKTRIELRKIRARIAKVVTGGRHIAADEGGNSRKGQTTPYGERKSASENAELFDLHADYMQLYRTLQQLRGSVPPGDEFSILARPYRKLTMANLHDTLEIGDEDRAILLLLDVGEGNLVRGSRYHAVVVRKRHQSMVELPDLGLVLEKLTLYPDSQRYLSNKSAYSGEQRFPSSSLRDGPAPSRAVSFGEVVPIIVDQNFQQFWEPIGENDTDDNLPLSELLRRSLWEPLKDCLSGVKYIFNLSHGGLHVLPLLCGLPDGLDLRNYPGLVFYAQNRWLAEKKTLGLRAFLEQDGEPVGVFAYCGSKKDIPCAKKEIEWVWRMHNGLRPLKPYSVEEKDPAPVYFLHLACHGAADEHRHGRTQLIVGDGNHSRRTLDMDDILEIPIRAKVVYLGCCLAGQTVEDLEGEPSGLVSGFFLRGACALVGSTVLIDDAWGAVFGVLFEHHLMKVDGKRPREAFFRAREDIASGNWDPTRVCDYGGFVEHVESLRTNSSSDTRTAKAPIPPQPILGDILYGMRFFSS